MNLPSYGYGGIIQDCYNELPTFGYGGIESEEKKEIMFIVKLSNRELYEITF